MWPKARQQIGEQVVPQAVQPWASRGGGLQRRQDLHHRNEHDTTECEVLYVQSGRELLNYRFKGVIGRKEGCGMAPCCVQLQVF